MDKPIATIAMKSTGQERGTLFLRGRKIFLLNREGVEEALAFDCLDSFCEAVKTVAEAYGINPWRLEFTPEAERHLEEEMQDLTDEDLVQANYRREARRKELEEVIDYGVHHLGIPDPRVAS